MQARPLGARTKVTGLNSTQKVVFKKPGEQQKNLSKTKTTPIVNPFVKINQNDRSVALFYMEKRI